MRVLVTAASRHGATLEIAEAVGDALAQFGVDAAVLPIDDVGPGTVSRFDAVVLGSAVYGGHWLPAAKDLVARDLVALAARPVWLFSSGPVGDPLAPMEDPADVASVRTAIGAREHRLFGGRLDRAHLDFAERAIATALRAPRGDFRPWADIRDWAAHIARSLTGTAHANRRSRAAT